MRQGKFEAMDINKKKSQLEYISQIKKKFKI